jgi:hypothetical protein
MSRRKQDWRNIRTGALGYLAGAAAGLLLIIIIAQMGLVRWLLGLVDQGQALIKLLAVPVIVGLFIALGGALLGGIGGWALGPSWASCPGAAR